MVPEPVVLEVEEVPLLLEEEEEEETVVEVEEELVVEVDEDEDEVGNPPHDPGALQHVPWPTHGSKTCNRFAQSIPCV